MKSALVRKFLLAANYQRVLLLELGWKIRLAIDSIPDLEANEILFQGSQRSKSCSKKRGNTSEGASQYGAISSTVLG
jgi:hypothetical protein